MADAPGELARHFNDLADPRIDRTKKHSLLDIVIIAICATICGADGWTEIAEFGETKEGWPADQAHQPRELVAHAGLRLRLTFEIAAFGGRLGRGSVVACRI